VIIKELLVSPKYTPDKPYTFYHRLEMCEAVNEGCELEDAIKNITRAARILHAFDDFHSEMILLIAENLCRGYVKGLLWTRHCDWDDYNECDPEVYAHFTGGSRKLTEEEFNEP
jgi:hypothetical protein